MFGITNGYDGTCQTMLIVFPVLLDNHLPWMPPVFDIFPSFLLLYERVRMNQPHDFSSFPWVPTSPWDSHYFLEDLEVITYLLYQTLWSLTWQDRFET